MNGRTLLEALQEKKERRVEATNTAIAAAADGLQPPIDR